MIKLIENEVCISEKILENWKKNLIVPLYKKEKKATTAG